MAYIDLNPVRAAMAEDLIDSDFTSIQQRLFDYAKHKKRKNDDEKRLVQRVQDQRKVTKKLNIDKQKQAPLMPFCGSSRMSVDVDLPFTQDDYFDLVDSTGRLIKENKLGFIKEKVPPVLQQLGINSDYWIEHVLFFGKKYSACVGREIKMRKFVSLMDRGFSKGIAS